MEKLNFSDSEAEFWQDLDKQLDLTPGLNSNKINEQKLLLEEESKVFMETVPVAYYRERMEKLISDIRISTQMQLEANLIKSTKTLMSKHFQELSEIKKLHSEEVSSLKLDFIKLERITKEKDVKISELERYIIEQELSISNLRIDKKEKYSEEARVKEILEEMKINKIAFDIQMAHMRELVAIYQKESDNSLKALKSLEDVNESNLQAMQELKVECEREISEITETCNKKIKLVNDKYENFKADVEKELNIRFVINKRQNEFIDLLKKELKDAKTVIETPRLNAKYLNRLGRRGFSLAGTTEEAANISKANSKIMHKKHSIITSSFSTSASPMYSNASEMELNYSHKFVGDSKLH